MPMYILLLHEPPDATANLSPAEIQAVIEKYRTWAGALAAKGHLRGGEKLQDGTGRVIKQERGSVLVTDGPYCEGKDLIGGYFLIEAKDYAEAARLAEDCPQLQFGPVEIREIEPTS